MEIGEWGWVGSPGRTARFEEEPPNLLSAWQGDGNGRLEGGLGLSVPVSVRLDHWAGCDVCSIYSGCLFARVALLRPHGSGETEAIMEEEGRQRGTAGGRLQLRPGPAPAGTLQQKPQRLSAIVSHLQ